MSRIKKVLILLSLVLCTTLIIVLSCTLEETNGTKNDIEEDTAYTNIISNFIISLDEGDVLKLKSMFSKKAQLKDDDLETEINQLINWYPVNKTIKGINYGYAEVNQTSDGHKEKATIHTRFPIAINGDYYWLDFVITYRDDTDTTNVGINMLTILGANEMYAVENDGSKLSLASSEGLTLLIDKTRESNIRCVEGHPYYYRDSTPLDLEAVREQLKKSLKYSDFEKVFGEANAKDKLYIYELPNENGEERYLSIMLIGNTNAINNVRVVDAFEWKDTILG